MTTVRRALAVTLVAIFIAGAAACTEPRPRRGGPADASGKTDTGKQAGWFESACGLPFDHLQRLKRGFFPGRMPDVMVVPREPNFFGSFVATSHSGPWSYLQEVPLLFYGPGFIRSQGEVALEGTPTVADIAPTWAELLGTTFPDDRPGNVLSDVLEPPEERNDDLALIVTVVWDGGGWNTLRRWPESWSFLAELMEKGTVVTNATVGSSPSSTPATHATMGTGTFPEDHGIAGIPITGGEGTVDSWKNTDPKNLEVETLADLYDRASGNEAVIATVAEKAWHLGMMGHGAFSDGGDHDIAVLHRPGGTGLRTNPEWYSMPSYMADLPGLEEDRRMVDSEDGKVDDRWGDIELTDDPEIVKTPAWVFYQNRMIEALLTREGLGGEGPTDLLFTNYKPIDHVGHRPGLSTPAMESVLSFSDRALRDLVAMLDREVGKQRWALALTADHGVGPEAEETGAWPIDIQGTQQAIAAHFGAPPEEMLDDEKPNGFWLDDAFAEDNGIEAEQVADFLLDYRLGDDAGNDIPEGYEERTDERLFEAAFPADQFRRIWRCALRRRS